MDFEIFRSNLEAALGYADGAKGGRPPYDPVLMFKILVTQAQHGLSDDKAEFLINDRLPFMRFLGLGLSDRVSAPILRASPWFRLAPISEYFLASHDSSRTPWPTVDGDGTM